MKKNKIWALFMCMSLIIGVIPTQAFAASEYVWPTSSHRITQKFSSSHHAIDIGVNAANIYASRGGEVFKVYEGCSNYSGYGQGRTCTQNGCTSGNIFWDGYCNDDFGNGVIIRHDDGTYAGYAHMSTVSVKRNQRVEQGTLLGVSGSSGKSKGPHLHFYVAYGNAWGKGGGFYNPETLLSSTTTSTANFSNIAASDISETNAKLSASVSYSGNHPSEVGIYLGESTGSMRKVGSDQINHDKNPFDMWYDLNKCGVTLSPGTQYYYKMYAIVNGEEFTSKTKDFWTSISVSINGGSTTVVEEPKPEPAPQPVAPTPEPEPEPASTTPVNPDRTGMPAVWTEGSTVYVEWNSVPNTEYYDVYLLQDPWRWDSIKHSGTTKGTNYKFADVADGYYGAFVVTRPNIDAIQSEWRFFDVKTAQTPTANFYNINASNVSQTNAQLNASISYSGNRPYEVGVYFGDSPNSMWRVGSDAINHSKNPFDMWYSLNKYGVTLSPGTTYYYQMYAAFEGTEIKSNVASFTTPAAASYGNVVTARVSGTPGGLAINSQPNKNYKIGRMDEGVYCTIDLDRTSGNWYYVTYNGVSGYAYNRYLVIQ